MYTYLFFYCLYLYQMCISIICIPSYFFILKTNLLYLIYIFDLFDKNENILWVLYFGTELTLFYSNSMLFLKYRDNDSCFLPSSYPYLIGRTLNHYKIKPTVSICIMVLYLVKFQSRSFKNVDWALTDILLLHKPVYSYKLCCHTD